MKSVIYISRVCTKSKFSELMKKRTGALHQPAQKFHDLIVTGLANNGVRVNCVSSLPLYDRKSYVPASKERENNIAYYYVASSKYILRLLIYFVNTFLQVCSLVRKEKKTLVVCDVLDVSIGMGALLAAKMMRVKFVGIITDLPEDLYKDKNVYVKLSNYLIEHSDGYVFLSEFMNRKINRNGKKYVIIEGLVESTPLPSKQLSKERKVKNCMYAGALEEKYGVKTLVDAFEKMNNPDYCLHVYGYGGLETYIRDKAKHVENIKFYGLVDNQQIVEAEVTMDLLVNPRPSDEQFTLYSFPSKNMEYMASGTPILCTKLKCIPKEYFPYMYFIEDESLDGFVDSLNTHMSKSVDELYEFGANAKKWILSEKNKTNQTKKILEIFS